MKLRNVSIVMVLLLVVSLALAGCGDPVAADIKNFDKSCMKVTDAMAEVERSLSNVSASNASQLLIENSEKIESIKKEIEAIEVKTDELKSVSSLLVEGLGLIAEGSRTMGEQSKDPENADLKVVEDAQNKLQKGMELFSEFATKYEALAKEHGLEVRK